MLLDLLLTMYCSMFSHTVTINTLCVSYVQFNAGFGIMNTRSLTKRTSKDTLDYDTICLIFGTILGDSCLYKRKHVKGCLMCLTQGAANYQY